MGESAAGQQPRSPQGCCTNCANDQADKSPDPNLLGVKLWLNAYRSGDYVGRSVWLDEWYNRVDLPIQSPPTSLLTTPQLLGKKSVSALAPHQHYWDQSAPDIAEKLDDLIK